MLNGNRDPHTIAKIILEKTFNMELAELKKLFNFLHTNKDTTVLAVESLGRTMYEALGNGEPNYFRNFLS